MEFRLRAGANFFSLNGTGQFPQDIGGGKQDLGYAYQPGWELGSTATFNGRGGFLRINVDVGLSGRRSSVNSSFYGDTATYIRDGIYNTTWLQVGAIPELKTGRNSRLSVLAGPYLGLLLSSRLKGTLLPDSENKVFRSTNDFKRLDIGLLFGLQYKVNFGKKDLDGRLGLRAQLGLKDLDNLYNRDCDNPAFCNGQVKWRGIALYYSINLLKL
ncbi:MAG TPA: outer membrane beta-barrel protein [Saprospiraceae bacterium]|nr:outer membrane beta-barrel protein [Saprospiraceae bacterium]